MPSTAPKRPRLCSETAWLRCLSDPASRVELRIARYFNRRGVFGARDETLPEHLLMFVEQGTLIAQVDGQTLRLEAGMAVIAPPGAVRSVIGSADGRNVRQHNLRFVVSTAGPQWTFLTKYRVIENAWELQPLLTMLQDLFDQGHALAQARLRGLLTVVSTEILARGASSPESSRRLNPGQRQRLARFIADHLAQPLSASDLAAEIELSGDYFTRVFRATYGMAPRFYLKRERMRTAAISLRETSLPLKRIARGVGITSESLFCRQFKAVMGCSPAAYRRREAPLPND